MTEALISLFFRELEAGRLIGSRCKSCGQTFIPPRKLCSNCRGETETLNLEGEGTLESFTVIHVPPSFLRDAAPYVVALVRLDGGARVMGRLLGCNPNEPEKIRIGSRVKFEVLREKIKGQEKPVVAFRLSEA